MSIEPEVPAVSFVVIARDGSHQEQVFPSALKLKPLDRVLWHTNPAPGERSEEGTFRVTFDGASPFDLTEIHGQMGGSSQIATVRSDALITTYKYTVGLQTTNGARRYDPEIIIEEAPADPPVRAATRAAGSGA